jgi:hypothetical protein
MKGARAGCYNVGSKTIGNAIAKRVHRLVVLGRSHGASLLAAPGQLSQGEAEDSWLPKVLRQTPLNPG